jgi:hypothetical protein
MAVELSSETRFKGLFIKYCMKNSNAHVTLRLEKKVMYALKEYKTQTHLENYTTEHDMATLSLA